MRMLDREATGLVLVDLQTKLMRAMPDADELTANVAKIIRGAQILGVPVLWAEQNPDGLGPTIPEIACIMPGQPVPKMSFSCCDEPAFVQALEKTGIRQVLLAGIEAHVCVHQTAAHLIQRRYEVHIIADAVSSRTETEKLVALRRAADAGAVVTTVECALFEMLRTADAPEFKQILEIVK